MLRIPPAGAAADEQPDGGDARTLTSGHFDFDPVVSPDCSTVVFTRTVEGTPALFSIPATGGEPVALTSGLLVVGAPVLSPDGRTIAFAALVDDHAADPPLPLVIEGEAVLQGSTASAGWAPRGCSCSRCRLPGAKPCG